MRLQFCICISSQGKDDGGTEVVGNSNAHRKALWNLLSSTSMHWNIVILSIETVAMDKPNVLDTDTKCSKNCFSILLCGGMYC